WRGRIASYCVIGAIAVALLPMVAEATTPERVGFAQTAMVTHWSLPWPDRSLGAFPEPAFAPAAPAPLPTLAPSPALASALSPKEPATSASAQPTGPTLAKNDLEARGTLPQR